MYFYDADFHLCKEMLSLLTYVMDNPCLEVLWFLLFSVLCTCFILFEVQFKEHDVLEGILKFWRNDDKKYFDLPSHW